MITINLSPGPNYCMPQDIYRDDLTTEILLRNYVLAVSST